MTKFVLDSSALLSGIDIIHQQKFEFFVTNSVLEEVRAKEPNKVLEHLKLKVTESNTEYREIVLKKVQEMGELKRLSKVDIEVLAVALELKAVIITDDYSIQNVAWALNIEYMPLAQRGIVERVIWKYRCRGCGKYFSSELSTSCPICGSVLRTVREK